MRIRVALASVLAVVLQVVNTAPAGAAVSLDLVVASDPLTHTPGSTITLETIVTANGGETDNTIFGSIIYPDEFMSPNAIGNWQAPLFTSQGALSCPQGRCVAFSQVNAAGPIAVNLTNFLLASTTFIIGPATPVGTVLNFRWHTAVSSARLDWFGITNAPGVSITVVPEPSSAALIAAGLLGLVIAVRRRV